jgi:iron complex transport system ATP-binding protein
MKPRKKAGRTPAVLRLSRATRPVLDIRGLVVHRDGTLILDRFDRFDRLDWRVQRGEHWVILGANGSGKTSLLSALTALPHAERGRDRSVALQSCA